MRDPGHRFLRPVLAGRELRHPEFSGCLALVEPADLLSCPGLLTPGDVVVADVHPQRHRVLIVVRQQAEPLLVASLVKQIGLPVQEIRDLGQ